MSVTTAGIKGYEFQYKVTVLIGLLRLSEAEHLFVEKDGCEDAIISLDRRGVRHVFDVQMKNSSVPVDQPLLAQWLRLSAASSFCKISCPIDSGLIICWQGCILKRET
jgi:hypothetical protein